MKFAGLFLACFFFVACGTAPGILDGTVGVARDLSLASVQSLDVAFLSPGAGTSCADAASWFTQDVVYHHFTAANALHLADVPSGKNWVVVVTAYGTTDGSGDPVGQGCASGVNVSSGQTEKVSVTLDATP